MREIDKLIIHCSATRENVAVTVEEIGQWHRERGYAGIGYHYVVYLDGTISQGRPDKQKGAHTLGYNASSIGICYVGGLDAAGQPKDTRTAAQKTALVQLINELKERYPGVSVHGHNEFSAKACPCFDVRKEFAI